MSGIIGIINVFNERDGLRELTRSRCVGSVPFGGGYRLIDFPLSAMAHSGIPTVAVLADRKSRSLIGHLASAKDWNLGSKRGGLFTLPPLYAPAEAGDIANFINHLKFIESCKGQTVAISPSRVVSNVDYSRFLDQHADTGAEVTLLYQKAEPFGLYGAPPYHKLDVRTDGSVAGCEPSADVRRGDRIYLHTFVMEKVLFFALLHSSSTDVETGNLEDTLLKHLGKFKVSAFQHEGFAAVLDTVEDYFAAHMKLLEPSAWARLFTGPAGIASKSADIQPAQYRASSDVRHSLVSGGCLIEGAVENSVLFPGVHVATGANVRNSIILQDCVIQAGARLESVVLDKGSHVAPGFVLEGTLDKPVVSA